MWLRGGGRRAGRHSSSSVILSLELLGVRNKSPASEEALRLRPGVPRGSGSCGPSARAGFVLGFRVGFWRSCRTPPATPGPPMRSCGTIAS